MIVEFSKSYEKRYKKLGKREKDAVKSAILCFMENPEADELRNHALKGKFLGYRSIDAGFDLRVIFREEDGYVLVVFVDVGSHNQIYG